MHNINKFIFQIIEQRKLLSATHLLPEISIHNEVKSASLLPAGVLIEEPELTEALKASGIDITSLFLFDIIYYLSRVVKFIIITVYLDL